MNFDFMSGFLRLHPIATVHHVALLSSELAKIKIVINLEIAFIVLAPSAQYV